MKGKEEKAHRALARLLRQPADSHTVQVYYSEVSANLAHELSIGETSYLACFRSGEAKNAKRVWTGIGIQALQQLTGVNFIFYYGTTFFANSGISNPFIITSMSPLSWPSLSRSDRQPFSRHQRRERRHDDPGHPRCRQGRPSSSAPIRRYRDVHLSM